MADNDKSKLRYDDFVSNVQPDPAKPESTIMLAGFVGHGPEGHARIYPDPTLGTWYDVPEGDVVHSMPIADSKLGGSYVWVRASADIKPGNAAPKAADSPQAAAAIHPTPTAQTHFFICPPTLTQQAWCPTQAAACNTQPVVCGIVPPTLGCQQGAARPQPAAVMAAGAPPNTGAAANCTMQAVCWPTVGCPTVGFVCPTMDPECFRTGGGPLCQTIPICAQAPHPAAAAAGLNPMTLWCTLMTCPQICLPLPNGVFTPFGR